MFNTTIPLDMKMTFRDKARLNICMAKDLAENFGGRKADYLKRLNRKLRMRIAFKSNHFAYDLAKAA